MITGLGPMGVRAETAEEALPVASQNIGVDAVDAGVSAANLRWDERPSYNRGNGWWPPSYGDNLRSWRPRTYAARPYWYDRRGYGWHRRAPYARSPDTRLPDARYGSHWAPRYGWPGYGHHYPYPRRWDRDLYGNAVPDWRYGYASGWARGDTWR